MSTTTSRLALIKPSLTDAADVTTTNTNWDTLDKAVTAPNGSVSVKLQYGSITFGNVATGNTASQAVTFPTAFVSSPMLFVQIDDGTFSPLQVTAGWNTKNATGFTCNVANNTGSTVTPTVNWIAIGN